MQKPMFHKTWNEKQAEYKAEHNAYMAGFKAKNQEYKTMHNAYLTGFNEKEKAFKTKHAAFNANEKANFAAHHQAFNQAMGALNKETHVRNHAQAHAVSAHAHAVSTFNKSLGKYMF